MSTRTYATVVITNAAPQNGSALNVNGTNRFFVTAVTNASINVAITNTIGGNMTNLFNQIVVYPYPPAGPSIQRNATTNGIFLIGGINQALTVTTTGGWAQVTYSTNTVGDGVPVRMPITVETNSVRTNIASGLVEAIRDYPTNAFPLATPALSNFVDRGTAQTVSNKILKASALEGRIYVTNSPVIAGYDIPNDITNLFNFDISDYVADRNLIVRYFDISTNDFTVNPEGTGAAGSADNIQIRRTVFPVLTNANVFTKPNQFGQITNTPIVFRGLTANLTNGIAFQGVTGTNYVWLAPDTNGIPSLYFAPGGLSNAAVYSITAENILNRALGDARYGQLGASNYWSTTNGFKGITVDFGLGIGTTNVPTGNNLEIDGQIPTLTIRGASVVGSVSGLQVFQKSRGSTTNQTAVVAGDNLMQFTWQGFGTTNYHNSAFMRVIATDTFNDTNTPAQFRFLTTPSTTIVPVEVLRLDGTNVDIFTGLNISTSLRVGGLGIYNTGHSNSTFTGTNTWNGDLDFPPVANTALANGYNADILLGTNVYVKLSGASLNFTNAGFIAERTGNYHILQIANPNAACAILNDNGLEGTAANRVLTGTGGDLFLTNNPAFIQVIYDGGSSRWRVITKSN